PTATPHLLTLHGEPHAGDPLAPAGAGTGGHCRPWNLAAWGLRRGGGERVGGRGRWVKEVPVSCGFRGWGLILWRFYAGFRVPTRETGGITRVFACPGPSRRRHSEQSRADRCTGHADRAVEGRCRPGYRSPVRRQGHHRGRAQEG